jgi:hypothetical protein
VTGACEVPKMPDGDKGGEYFALHGILYRNTPCIAVCAGNLNLSTATGQAGWTLVSGPGISTPRVPVVVTLYPGWSALPGASWVSVDASRGNQTGDYVYEYQFCLCAMAKGSQLSGTLRADNSAVVRLNGVVVATFGGNSNFTGAVRTFSYSAAAGWIIPGTNKLTITVHNESSVTGLAATVAVRADNGLCPR